MYELKTVQRYTKKTHRQTIVDFFNKKNLSNGKIIANFKKKSLQENCV